jgi:spore coat protein A
MNRRQFFRMSAGAAAYFAFPRRGYSYAQSPPNITKFAVSLPGLGPSGKNQLGNYIAVATPNKTKFPGIDYYEIAARKYTQQLHPNLGPTTLLGYADASGTGDPTNTYLGGLIVAKRGRPVRLKAMNLLEGSHPLPVDATLMGAEDGSSANRITVHLHGGLVHWDSDGGPFSWFDPLGNTGSSFVNGTGVPGEAVYNYPNDQSARLVWYHDHALGYTRLNAYAGLASGYLITDSAEAQLVQSGLIPDIQIPLIIQDKTFEAGGGLWYPSVYEANADNDPAGRWDTGPGFPPPSGPSCVPEFFADTILVNGAPYPTVKLDAKRYRFRILNGSQARFFNLQMYVKDDSYDGITLKASSELDNEEHPLQIPTNPAGPAFIQIGTEGGFLPLPVPFASYMNGQPVNSNRPLGYDLSGDPESPAFGIANRFNLLLAPAERADLIVDFSAFKGQKIILYNDAPAPFPTGDERNDYYPGAPDQSAEGGAHTPVPGCGPDTRILMQFEIGTTTVADLDFGATLQALAAALPITFIETQPSPLRHRAHALPKRPKTLNEDFDYYGRLRQVIGTTKPTGRNSFGMEYLDTPTEIVDPGEVQVWRIFNLTGDTHPMHFHLVNVQIVQRAQWAYDIKTIDGASTAVPKFDLIPGTQRPPDPNELGWKETVRINPGEAMDVIMKFDLPPGQVPDSPRLLQEYGIRGSEYVWHCHILEHEEHDMMRPLVVRSDSRKKRIPGAEGNAG